MPRAISILVSELIDGVAVPPTDLDAVARKVKVHRFLAEDIPGSGELRRDEAGLTIVYSSSLSKPRQRFTIAHEIAHAYFECNWADLPRPNKEVEQLCDMIAAEILMPATVVSKLIETHLNIETILRVARTFQVSLPAAAIRCSELKRATVFEVSEAGVTWGCGFVRKGKVDRLNPGLQSVIHRALKGQAGEEELLLDGESGLWSWRAEFRTIVRGRALVLLRPRQENDKTDATFTSRA